MGRGRAKGKKQSNIGVLEDAATGEEEKVSPNRKRGRPQKAVRDEIEEEETVKEGEVEDAAEDIKITISDKEVNNKADMENGRKRKRSSQLKESSYPVKGENGVGTKTGANDSLKSVGFRPNGSRRKNKPRRAAEVGVECK
ncbi:hypothetical protein NMG60_11001839 [Bertholletia excelsa]